MKFCMVVIVDNGGWSLLYNSVINLLGMNFLVVLEWFIWFFIFLIYGDDFYF